MFVGVWSLITGSLALGGGRTRSGTARRTKAETAVNSPPKINTTEKPKFCAITPPRNPDAPAETPTAVLSRAQSN